jgi:hypothetical protein
MSFLAGYTRAMALGAEGAAGQERGQ